MKKRELAALQAQLDAVKAKQAALNASSERRKLRLGLLSLLQEAKGDEEEGGDVGSSPVEESGADFLENDSHSPIFDDADAVCEQITGGKGGASDLFLLLQAAYIACNNRQRRRAKRYLGIFAASQRVAKVQPDLRAPKVLLHFEALTCAFAASTAAQYEEALQLIADAGLADGSDPDADSVPPFLARIPEARDVLSTDQRTVLLVTFTNGLRLLATIHRELGDAAAERRSLRRCLSYCEALIPGIFELPCLCRIALAKSLFSSPSATRFNLQEADELLAKAMSERKEVQPGTRAALLVAFAQRRMLDGKLMDALAALQEAQGYAGESTDDTRADIMATAADLAKRTSTMDRPVADEHDEALRECAADCGATERVAGSFPLCARCRNVAYCGRTCQRAHWSTHKPSCGSGGSSTSRS